MTVRSSDDLPRYSTSLDDYHKVKKRRRFQHGGRSRLQFLRWNCSKPHYHFVLVFICIYTVLLLRQRYFTAEKTWLFPVSHLAPPVSLVYSRENLARVWAWEVEAGHYPSRQPLPELPGLEVIESNPAIPASDRSKHGSGAERRYIIPKGTRSFSEYPPRPIPGSAVDMDIIMDNCDYSQNKYVRDCLKLLRTGAGMESFNVTSSEQQPYIFTEDTSIPRRDDVASNVVKRWSSSGQPYLDLPPVPRPASTMKSCNRDDPRVFHMFWTGPYTDKPYMTILSFLFTQNLHLHLGNTGQNDCRPQLWMWVYQPRWTAYRRVDWDEVLLEDLLESPWVSPFLNARFREVVVFKVWDVYEQLDGTPELQHEWKNYERHIFKSSKVTRTHMEGFPDGNNVKRTENEASSSFYDKLAVAHSDLVRFVLCHRYGGIYLDTDTLFLRDWEELWGWQGAFAYRWSRMDRYNTAVLRMHKGSALGTFMLRTGLKNGLEFHPIRVTRYLKDAGFENLLMRAPDALFDPAWLVTEGYHTDRPPQPFFKFFEDFFDTPDEEAAGPEALGVTGFFKGAFSYHYHNHWWTPFDPDNDAPNLGPRFSSGVDEDDLPEEFEGPVDISWSAVFKRTYEAYIRGERPNLYGEWLCWDC